jgi:hypothetical protein
MERCAYSQVASHYWLWIPSNNKSSDAASGALTDVGINDDFMKELTATRSLAVQRFSS